MAAFINLSMLKHHQDEQQIQFAFLLQEAKKVYQKRVAYLHESERWL